MPSGKLKSSVSCFIYLRIPYGIYSVSEVCQASIAIITAPIEVCRNAQDGIIIWVGTPGLLESRTIEVLQAIRQSGLKLNHEVSIQLD